MNNTCFEVIYTALQAPDTAHDCAVVVSRARTAMVSSRLVRRAPAPVFFERAGEGAVFIVRSASRETLAALPMSFGSAIGHFGIFERDEVQEIPIAERFYVAYTIEERFSSYSNAIRRRLTLEVGGRLKAYLAKGNVPVRVRPQEDNCTILVSGAAESVLRRLPLRFDAVFVRSTVMQLH